ncbi:MAG TPA: VOC family protein [Gaiellaceae bacterium]|nr:VOC family protein [Gaiellaceae bacterium]
MLDHVGLNVRDLAASRAFYECALEPLGYHPRLEHGTQIGFVGPERYPHFWLAQREPAGTGTHVCFRAEGRVAVDAFHAAGVAAGGTDNGGPGLRPQYDERYYAAFVLDPDGNNVEAVTYEAA